MDYKGLSVWYIYRKNLEQLNIPETYRVVDFAPPRPRQTIFSVMGFVDKATAQFDELCPRLILEEIEPCELCGDREPVTLIEIKKSAKARNYSIMLLCAGCVETNAKFIKGGTA